LDWFRKKNMQVSKEFSFDAAHKLVRYKGKCESLHGHTYRLRVTVEGPVREDGMVFDFTELKRIVEERVLSKVDHSYLNDLLEQPTAENIVMWLWDRLRDLPLAEIRLWESPGAIVTYNGPGS